MENNIPTLYILQLDSYVVKVLKCLTILGRFVQKYSKKYKSIHRIAIVTCAGKVSLRSVLI